MVTDNQEQEVKRLQTELETTKKKAETAQTKAEVLRAVTSSGLVFHDPEAVQTLLADQVAMKDGRVIVLDESGKPRQIGLDGLVREFSQHHEYFVDKQRTVAAMHQGYQLEDFFGPKASPKAGGILNKIALADIGRYNAMRKEAQERGLVPADPKPRRR